MITALSTALPAPSSRMPGNAVPEDHAHPDGQEDQAGAQVRLAQDQDHGHGHDQEGPTGSAAGPGPPPGDRPSRLAVTRMKATLASSEGCRRNGPSTSQRRAPPISRPDHQDQHQQDHREQEEGNGHVLQVAQRHPGGQRPGPRSRPPSRRPAGRRPPWPPRDRAARRARGWARSPTTGPPG